jgi:DNA invertase Pin-like site-specific DNA recombinase
MRRRSSRRRSAGHDPHEPVRAVAYVRLSKAKDNRENTEVGLGTQQAGCERAIAALGGSIVAVEQDIQSGDRLDRPGL